MKISEIWNGYYSDKHIEGYSREVYFNIRTDIWLKRYLENRTDGDPSLFVTERVPRRISIAQMRYVIKRI